ncbi:MAG: anti-sigma factor [Luteibaculum sp.]
MKKKDFIASGLLELYALGLCSPEEEKQVEEMLTKEDVHEEYDSIQEALIKVAESAATKAPSGLKAKILAEIKAEEPLDINREEPRVVEMPGRQKNPLRIWLRAAVAALVVSVSFNLLFMGNIQKAQQEIAQLRNVNQVLAQEYDILETNLDSAKRLNQHFAEGSIEAVELKSTNKIQQSAVVYWDKNSGQAMISAARLPEIPKDKSYQLWCLIDGVPMDMGVIPTEHVGKKELALLKSTDQKPQAFAITIEPYGGQEQPTLENLMVLGNVRS